MSFVGFCFQGVGQGKDPRAHPPSDSVVFPDLVPHFADEKKQKRTTCPEGIDTMPTSRFIY